MVKPKHAVLTSSANVNALRIYPKYRKAAVLRPFLWAVFHKKISFIFMFCNYNKVSLEKIIKISEVTDHYQKNDRELIKIMLLSAIDIIVN